MKLNIAEILTRLTIGWVFIESGWGKFQNLEKVTAFFESLHIPMASLQAPFVSGLELIAGVFIILGLFTRISGSLLSMIMVVALITAKREEIDSISSLLGTIEFLYIVLLVWLIAHCSHFLSLDTLIKRRFSKAS